MLPRTAGDCVGTLELVCSHGRTAMRVAPDEGCDGDIADRTRQIMKILITAMSTAAAITTPTRMNITM